MIKRFIPAGALLLALHATALADSTVTWSSSRDDKAIKVQSIIEAGKAIVDLWKKFKSHHPIVRFTKNGPGGEAVVPLYPYDPGSRASPNFDLAPFKVPKGQEVWAEFEFVNIKPEDAKIIAFAIKADKPGREDRYRADHDIGNGQVGNKPRMRARLATPTSGDYAYYFLDRGRIDTDEIVRRNPGAAIRITILASPRGGTDNN